MVSQMQQRLLLSLSNRPATLLNAATAASEATKRSCNALGDCNSCFRGHRTLLQRFRMLQLLLLRGHRAFLQRSRTLQLLLLQLQNTQATLPKAATAASEATGRLQRSGTLQLLLITANNPLGGTERSCNTPTRCTSCLWHHLFMLMLEAQGGCCNAPRCCSERSWALVP